MSSTDILLNHIHHQPNIISSQNPESPMNQFIHSTNNDISDFQDVSLIEGTYNNQNQKEANDVCPNPVSTFSKLPICAGCGIEIRDPYILKVSPDLEYHATCLKCKECEQSLDETCTCYVKNGSAYCKQDYLSLFGVKCSGCGQPVSKTDLVMRAKHLVFHMPCFKCYECGTVLLPGEEFMAKTPENLLFCKKHLDAHIYYSSFLPPNPFTRETNFLINQCPPSLPVPPYGGNGPVSTSYWNNYGPDQNGVECSKQMSVLLNDNFMESAALESNGRHREEPKGLIPLMTFTHHDDSEVVARGRKRLKTADDNDEISSSSFNELDFMISFNSSSGSTGDYPPNGQCLTTTTTVNFKHLHGPPILSTCIPITPLSASTNLQTALEIAGNLGDVNGTTNLSKDFQFVMNNNKYQGSELEASKVYQSQTSINNPQHILSAGYSEDDVLYLEDEYDVDADEFDNPGADDSSSLDGFSTSNKTSSSAHHSHQSRPGSSINDSNAYYNAITKSNSINNNNNANTNKSISTSLAEGITSVNQQGIGLSSVGQRCHLHGGNRPIGSLHPAGDQRVGGNSILSHHHGSSGHKHTLTHHHPHHHYHHHHHGGNSTSGANNANNNNDKVTRVRTVLNEKQLHTLRTCYNANPRPDALMKEQLVEMTGLSPRVIRVWFQNKRCKDKKRQIMMKQISQAQEKGISNMHGIPLIATSPVRHEHPPGTGPAFNGGTFVELPHHHHHHLLHPSGQSFHHGLHRGPQNLHEVGGGWNKLSSPLPPHPSDYVKQSGNNVNNRGPLHGPPASDHLTDHKNIHDIDNNLSIGMGGNQHDHPPSYVQHPML